MLKVQEKRERTKELKRRRIKERKERQNKRVIQKKKYGEKGKEKKSLTLNFIQSMKY